MQPLHEPELIKHATHATGVDVAALLPQSIFFCCKPLQLCHARVDHYESVRGLGL